ncbi:hypothetical protein [Streptomyces sp. NPDC058683]|uniref:hypothetical protein n=1 Tax=Streptomyces sp. NPDC058683 TaxID=3346597 RepID=UPI00364E052A
MSSTLLPHRESAWAQPYRPAGARRAAPARCTHTWYAHLAVLPVPPLPVYRIAPGRRG